MLTVGLLGLRATSTARYLQLVETLVRDWAGRAASRLVAVQVGTGEPAQGARTLDEARLVEAARQVEAAGADLLLLCEDALHALADRVTAAVGIPVLHAADAAAAAALARGTTTVGLLAGGEQTGYRARLEGHGLSVVVPGPDDQLLVQRGVEEVLTTGAPSEASRGALLGVLDRLAAAGAEGVVLASGEMELLVRQQDTGVPLFVASRLHAEAAVEAARTARVLDDVAAVPAPSAAPAAAPAVPAAAPVPAAHAVPVAPATSPAVPATPDAPRHLLLPDLFHVADAAEWAAGDYRRSTRGLDLDDVGFVHCAFAWQVQGVLDRFYADADEPLLLLRVDPDRAGAAVRVEPPPGSPEGFPHLYGPLRPEAVVEVLPLHRGPAGWQAPVWAV